MPNENPAPEGFDYDDGPDYSAPAEQQNALTTIRGSRLQLPPAIAKEYELEAPQWRVLVEQIFPAAKSVEAVLMALAYCKARNLDIYKKPVHIVPMYSSALKRMVETVWPGIAEIRTTATRTGDYAGADPVRFGPMKTATFTGSVDKWENRKRTGGTEPLTKEVTFPEWAELTAYRFVHGVRVPFTAMVFWEETYASVGRTDVPNEMWAKRPRGQIFKCVEAAALRMAFPEEAGGMYAAEEMEGRVLDVTPGGAGPVGVAGPVSSGPPIPPPASGDGAKIIVADKSPQGPAGGHEGGAATTPAPTAGEAPGGHAGAAPEGGEEIVEPLTAEMIDDELSVAKDDAEVEEFFDRLDVQTRIAGDDAIAAAFKVRDKHRARIARTQTRAKAKAPAEAPKVIEGAARRAPPDSSKGPPAPPAAAP